MIVNQIKLLINTLPRTDSIDISLKFASNDSLFEKSLRETFGKFYTQKELKQNVRLKNKYTSNFSCMKSCYNQS
jgi:hypothetical protein